MRQRHSQITRRTFAGATLGALAATRRIGLFGHASAEGGRRASDAAIEAQLARLSLAEKVAQLFMVDVLDLSLTPDDAAWLTRDRPGGVILLGNNIGTPEEVAALVAAIHATNPDLPPLVAVDQEGGPVSRLAGDPAPGAVALGQLPDDEVAAFARARADYVASFGFDVNFAPVADVAYRADSIMAERAFGADPVQVAAKVAAVVAGGAESGVLHAAKHFPGHGRSPLDSHELLPEIDLSPAAWSATDALPFQAAIEAGVPIVMLGHLRYSQWDDLPTSLSGVTVEMLRGRLGFDGVIVTDDLAMAAVADRDPFAIVDWAIAAGVDWLLFGSHAVPVSDLIAYLQDQVASGTVAETRIDESVRRLLRLRFDR